MSPIVIGPPVVLSLLVLGLLVVGQETLPRIRVGSRRLPENPTSLPLTSLGSGRSLSGSSGWRVSLNNLGHRWKSIGDNSSSSSSSDDWTAVVKNQTTTTVPGNTSALDNPLPHPPPKYPLRNIISKPAVGNMRRKPYGQSTVIPSFIPTTTTTTTTTAATPTEAQLPPRVPIPKIGKNYVQIERRKKEGGGKSNNVTAAAAAAVRNSVMAGEYRAVGKQLESTQSGRGFMRRNGELQQQFPHQYQGQGQAQHPHQHHQQQQQQYLPLPQQHGEFIDPYHPVLQHNLNQPPHNPLQLQQHHQQPYHQHPSSKHDHHSHGTSLLPLDKTLVYVSMIVTWIFWIVAFTTYHSLWSPHGKIHRNGGPIPGINIEDSHGKQTQESRDSSQSGSVQPHVIHARSLDTSIPSGWNVNWGQVLYMISLAQEAYEKFDFRSMDCQKKALCELSQQQEEFGETGRKISSTFSIMDAVEGLPMPTIIQNYLKEYRSAVNAGKNTDKSCAEMFSTCGFSLKEIVSKYQKKAATGKF